MESDSLDSIAKELRKDGIGSLYVQEETISSGSDEPAKVKEKQKYEDVAIKTESGVSDSTTTIPVQTVSDGKDVEKVGVDIGTKGNGRKIGGERGRGFGFGSSTSPMRDGTSATATPSGAYRGSSHPVEKAAPTTSPSVSSGSSGMGGGRGRGFGFGSSTSPMRDGTSAPATPSGAYRGSSHPVEKAAPTTSPSVSSGSSGMGGGRGRGFGFGSSTSPMRDGTSATATPSRAYRSFSRGLKAGDEKDIHPKSSSRGFRFYAEEESGLVGFGFRGPSLSYSMEPQGDGMEDKKTGTDYFSPQRSFQGGDMRGMVDVLDRLSNGLRMIADGLDIVKEVFQTSHGEHLAGQLGFRKK
eukprot:TRINITY_DN488_c0_g1_i1.p2 TRINITY_DN488_c0_g1~~TRINITY_DN488_c0_g1_i1.p2  ORF type:complete len:366 (+),score=115.10 TRINITY_DN488_c0_g1_i1:39-1100(+)